jgi:hypothetical protein
MKTAISMPDIILISVAATVGRERLAWTDDGDGDRARRHLLGRASIPL